ncbi:MAG TPA: hypothetical protein VGB25_04780 [Candidatus Binatia bacterium]
MEKAARRKGYTAELGKKEQKADSPSRQVGAGHFMGMFHIGNLDHQKVMASLKLFRREVMPRLAGGKTSIPAC